MSLISLLALDIASPMVAVALLMDARALANLVVSDDDMAVSTGIQGFLKAEMAAK